MTPLEEKLAQLERLRLERAQQEEERKVLERLEHARQEEERKARERLEAEQQAREQELEMELEVLRLEEEEEQKRQEETEKKQKEEMEKRAAEISQRKVERSWAAQEEYRKSREAGNAATGSSKTVEEPSAGTARSGSRSASGRGEWLLVSFIFRLLTC